ncbi:hypothetical protein HZR84_12040 [Hyphobacterium sp. CCMP332]|nr:hypothetical protein HZR84_12040 [Hyphobacterium sp. CCMP332]
MTTGRVFYIIIVTILIILGGLNFQAHFNPVKDLNDKIYDIIISIGVVTILMERVLEILIKIWRGTEKIKLESERDKLKERLNLDRQKFKEGILDKDNFKSTQDEFQKADENLEEFRSETTKIALRSSFLIGIFIALVGFRVLGPIYTIPTGFEDFQKNLFYMCDIFLSAGVISGGSEGLHLLTSVLGNFLKETKKNLKEQKAE